MKKFVKKVMLFASCVALLSACGKEEKENKDTQKQEQKEKFEGNFTFTPLAVEAYYYDSAKNRSDMIDIQAFDATISVNEYGASVASKSPYNGLDFWIDTYYGSTYPISTGTYQLGATPEEQSAMTCTTCLVFSTGKTLQDIEGKTHLAVSGSVTISSIEDGHLRAKAENLVLKEYKAVYETKVNDKGIEYQKMVDAPFVENGSELKIAEINLDSDAGTDNIMAIDCDGELSTAEIYACANSLNITVEVKK